MRTTMRYLLIIRLKRVRGYGTRIDLYLDTYERVKLKIRQSQDQFKDRYIGYTLYELKEEA